MKVLKIDNKKCFYSKDGINYMPITDISKDDIYSILGIIYTSSDYNIDEVNEQTEILNDVEKIIYTNIYGQLQTFIQNKETLKNEIDSELKDVLNKYKLNDGNDGDDNISVDSSEFENMLEEKIPESV
mgnify:FL=1